MFYLADLHNGIFAAFESEAEAEKAYSEAIASGIIAECEIQEESGLTNEQIKEKVCAFYLIIDQFTFDLFYK